MVFNKPKVINCFRVVKCTQIDLVSGTIQSEEFDVDLDRVLTKWQFLFDFIHTLKTLAVDSVYRHSQLIGLISSSIIKSDNKEESLSSLSHVEVEVNTEDSYSRLNSLKEFSFGDVVFEESPLIQANSSDIDSFTTVIRPILAVVLSKCDQAHRDLVCDFLTPLSFLSLVAVYAPVHIETKKIIMDLHCPKDSINLAIIYALELLAKIFLSSNIFNLSESGVLEEDIVRLIIISATNSFGSADGQWVALFKLGCRTNHSCLPNCRWNFDGRSLTFYALRTIVENEEITHAYFDRERWHPTHIRRNALLKNRFYSSHVTPNSILHLHRINYVFKLLDIFYVIVRHAKHHTTQRDDSGAKYVPILAHC